MKRTIVILILTLCVACFLTGCGPIKGIAKKKATEYVQEKYGIKAKAKSAKQQIAEGMFSGQATGTYLVNMEYEGEEFGVLISAIHDDEPGKDNYQADEIAHDLSMDIAACVGSEPYYYQLVYDFGSFDQYDRQYDNYFTDYYDGTNLYEVLDCWNGKITLVYTDSTDVRDVDLSPVGEKFANGLEEDSAWYLLISIFSFASEDEFELNREALTGREIYLRPYEIQRELTGIYDAQIFRYQNPTYHAARLMYANPDYGYEYTYSKDEYRYYGEGY